MCSSPSWHLRHYGNLAVSYYIDGIWGGSVGFLYCSLPLSQLLSLRDSKCLFLQLGEFVSGLCFLASAMSLLACLWFAWFLFRCPFTLTPIMGCLRKTVWLNFDLQRPLWHCLCCLPFPRAQISAGVPTPVRLASWNHLSLTCPRAPASVLTTRGALDTCSSSLMRKALDKGIDLNSYQASSSNLQWSVLPKTLYSCQANENNE